MRPTGKLYKVPDREGLYVAVTAAGSVSYRFNYRINDRQETLTLGRYGPGGMTLGEARGNAGETFGAWAEKWLELHQMADSTRDMRQRVFTVSGTEPQRPGLQRSGLSFQSWLFDKALNGLGIEPHRSHARAEPGACGSLFEVGGHDCHGTRSLGAAAGQGGQDQCCERQGQPTAVPWLTPELVQGHSFRSAARERLCQGRR